MKKELTFSRNRMLLLLVFASGISFSGCHKDKKNSIQFTLNAYIPYSNEPIPNVKWEIREVKSVYTGGYSFDSKSTGWKLEGETDDNGESDVEFYPKKNTKYSYFVRFDYSEMNLPYEKFKIIKGNPSAPIKRNNPVGNTFEVKVLPILPVQLNFMNANCFDETDSFKYKSYNLDEKPNYTQQYIVGMTWSQSSLFDGCVDYTGTYHDRLAGRYIYIWEAVRNGITETGTDTFFVAPGVNSVINMHW